LLKKLTVIALILSLLTTTIAGYAVSKDKGATTEYNISTSAELYNRQLYQREIAFLKQNSKDKKIINIYKQNMTPQNYFTSTKEQYKDNSYTPDTSIGLKDESYLFVPISPILKTTSKAGTTIGELATKRADELYLNTGIRVDNFIRNEVSPKANNMYYNTKNFIYDPENVMNAHDFLQGFDAKYPNITTKFPYINWHTGGFVMRKVVNEATK
jgi:hypothetical protein